MFQKIFSSFKKLLHKGTRIIVAAAYGFWEDDCYTKASTLTFYTVQSIVPFLAAVLAIGKGFGFDEYLENLITTTFQEQKEILNYAIQISYSMLKYIRGGEIAGIGVLLLLWTNLNLVGYIELALNDIWRIKTRRTLFHKLKDFCAAVIILPTVFVMSGSLTVYIKTYVTQLKTVAMLEPVSHLTLDLFKVLPLLLSCLLFFLLYILMPNTKIRVWPRLIASIIAGSAFQLWQVIYINFQIQIFSYNVVYGAFALLPLFLIWLQFSWLIALAGAEIAAHIENYRFYAKVDTEENLAKISRSELALLILYYCLRTFYEGTQPLSAIQIADKLKIPANIVQEILELLVDKGVLTFTVAGQGDVIYHPLYDPSLFRIKSICDIVDPSADFEILIENTEIVNRISTFLQNLHQIAADSEANVGLNSLFNFKPLIQTK